MSDEKPSFSDRLIAAGEKMQDAGDAVGKAGQSATKAGNSLIAVLFWGALLVVLVSCAWSILFSK